MKHNIKGRKLNRTSSHRKALFKNMANSLIEHEQIKTTLPKAKEIKSIVEKMITLGKKGTLAGRRKLLSSLQNETNVNKVFDVLAKRYKDRNGGYIRIMKFGFRYGDAAPMSIVEFVDRDEKVKGEKDKARVTAQKKLEKQNQE
ncbi:50S ribosomal protein L17 [Pseudomonadota bacterium]